MTWRQLLLSKRFVCTEPVKSIFCIRLLPFCYVADRFHHFNCNTISSRDRMISINPQVVQSTLANFQSDLVALNFFLCCARQRNYFHDRHAFSLMIDVLTRLVHRFGSIDGVLKELERTGCVTKPQNFLLLIRICWLGGMHNLMFDVIDTMGRYGYTTNTFVCNVVMDILIKYGQTDVAMRVLRENTAPNFLSYNIALCNLCKVNDLVNIRIVVQNMLRAGYFPNDRTFVMIMNCFSRTGRLGVAFQVLGLMVSLGIHTSVAVWSILIDGFCRLGRPDLANYILEKMISTGCSPTVVTYTSLVKGFLECKLVADAFRILGVMESRRCEIDLVLANVLITCLSKLQLYDDALAVFYDLRKRKLEPDAYTFSSLVSALCSSGEFYLLPKLLSCFDCPADLVVLNSLLSYFCKAGLPDCAVVFYHDMVARGFMVDKYSFAGLLTGLCRAQKFGEAVKFYHGMLIEGFELDAHIHTLIISELIRARKYETALSLFREAILNEYPLDSVSYAAAVQGLVKSKRVQEAFSLYNKMKGLGFNPDTFTVNMLLSGFCKERDIKMVKQLLKEMCDSDIELYIRSCEKVLNILSKSRHYQSVFNQLILMIDSGLLPENAIHMLESHCKLLRESSRDDLCEDISGSEDLIELAA